MARDIGFTGGGDGESDASEDEDTQEVDDQAGLDDDPFRAPGYDGGHTPGPTPEPDDGGGTDSGTVEDDDQAGRDDDPFRAPGTDGGSGGSSTGGSEDTSTDDESGSTGDTSGGEDSGGAGDELDYSDRAPSEEEMTTGPTPERQQQREQVADRFGVDESEVSLDGEGSVEFETEDARRAALTEQYGEGADVDRLGEGLFEVTTTTPTPLSGEAIAPPNAGGSDTFVVPFGDVGGKTLEDIQSSLDEQQAEAEQREQAAEDLMRGNLGDTGEIREEAAAEELSEQLDVPLTDEDITLRETDGDGYSVDLSDTANRAAALTGSAEFLRRDADVTREDGDLAVELPGDSDAIEEALTQRIQTGEAFGGETSLDVLGHTITLEQDLEAFGDGVESAASDALDFADDANLLSNQPAFTGNDSDSLSEASTVEASEDFTLQALEGGAAALGEIPSDLLEIGEAATDPLTYEVGTEAAMMGARQTGGLVTTADSQGTVPGPLGSLPVLNVEGVASTTQGAVETAGRLDAAARDNPEMAASIGAGVLGGAILTAGTYAAAPAALGRLGTVSPTAARAGEFALDPIRVSAQTGARTASRVDLPDAGTLRLDEFRADTRGMAQLTGDQKGASGDLEDATDGELGVPDDDPFRNSDARLYDPTRTFDEANDPSVDVDPTDPSGVSQQDIGTGISGKGNPQAAPGTDFTWDASPDSDDIRRAAERFQVRDGGTDFGDRIATADATGRLDADTRLAGLTELTAEGVVEDALDAGEDLAADALDDPGADSVSDAGSEDALDISDGVDVVVDGSTRDATDASADESAASPEDATLELDQGLMTTAEVTEPMTQGRGQEVTDENDFKARGRGSAGLPSLDSDPLRVDVGGGAGGVKGKTFSYNVASPSEVADGLDDDGEIVDPGVGDISLDARDESSEISLDLDVDSI